jgi:hypothetical protein
MQPTTEINLPRLTRSDAEIYRSINDGSLDVRDFAFQSVQYRLNICKKIFGSNPEIAKKLVETSSLSGSKLSTQIYGEIEFASFYHILQFCNPSQESIFVDLGHGAGKALLAAFLFCGDQFKYIHGIEYLPELYQESQRKIENLQQLLSDETYDVNSFLRCLVGNERVLGDIIQIEEGDFFDPNRFLTTSQQFDWRKADIVFANSTCFGFQVMEDLSLLALDMHPGSYFISFTVPLVSTIVFSAFKIVYQKTLPMSWGLATVYIHQRL